MESIKFTDSDYWDNGDYVTPLVGCTGQFTKGKEYKIECIDWDDIVYTFDDKGAPNGWHVSMWKFVREGKNEV